MIDVADEVQDALAERRPVVALESTIFSTLGLPSPANRDALFRSLTAVRAGGAVPAVTAVLDGRLRVGLADAEHDRILGAARKVSERELPLASAQRWTYGATTVSASLLLADRAGVRVFATGGIGGVHRGAEVTGDISADLDAIGRRTVITVSAGAKVFLDLGRTLEYLETAGVPVLGWRTDDFPAFYSPTSGHRVPHRVDSATEVASVARANWSLNRGGLLVTVPIPSAAAVDSARLATALDTALAAAHRQNITGAAVTPYVLGQIAAETGGDAIPANLALAEHNAAVAAEIAVALANPEG